MSNALALGAVTAVLKSLLDNRLASLSSILGGTPTVTVLAPDPEGGATGATTGDRLNLFLYQTNPNPSWRNMGLPSRNSSGDRISNPPLAVDLHYLLTAYTKDAFHAEILLGHAMQLLHETPVLGRDAIRSALRNLATSSEAAARALATADLADQVEQIKLSPQPMSTEEVSKLWSAIQTQYRPTVVYQASVVLIESQKSTQAALPVRERRVHVIPFAQPTIATLKPQIATQGTQLTLEGRNFRSDQVTVRFGTLTVVPDTLSDQQVQVTVPANLPAGINTVQIEQQLDFQRPPEQAPDLHRGFASNVMPFVLSPKIIGITAPNGIQAGKVDIVVQVQPVIRKTQKVILFLNEQGGIAAYSTPVPPRETEVDQITFTFNGVKAATYLARLQVDGANSALEADADPNSPTFNQYIRPAIALSCQGACLRVANLVLTATRNRDVLTVEASVTVFTETGAASPGVVVTVDWLLPNGDRLSDTRTTGTNGIDRGVTKFLTLGSPGTYTVTVTSLSKPGFSFDVPQSSALTRSVTG
jgi:hypothetical protein